MKKVLFYCVSGQLGGAERSFLQIIDTLIKTQNYKIKVLMCVDEGPLIDELISRGVEVGFLKFPKQVLSLTRGNTLKLMLKTLKTSPLILKYVYKLVKTLKTEAPDIIYPTGLKCLVLCCVSSLFYKSKYILHFRDIISAKYLKSFFYLFKESNSILWLANSEATKKAVDFLHAQVFYNGFNSNHFKKHLNSNFKKQLNIPSTAKVVGAMGVLAHWKGQHIFIEAAIKLCAKYEGVFFIIAGDEIYDTDSDRGYKQSLIKQINHSSYKDRILMTGFCKNPLDFYNSIDVFAHTSIEPEPFGRVIVEAQLCEVPTIATFAGGAREIIEHKKTGYLCEPGSITGLEKSIEELLFEDSLLKVVGQKSRESAKCLFGLTTFNKACIKYFA